MALENTAAKAATDTVKTGTRMVDTAIKKAWSILDAASEKRPPSEVLSEKAVSAIQGRTKE
jgi:hypothetical protein